jgi:hypothetical protein
MARILAYNYFTSTHPYAQSIHMISHEHTKLTWASNSLILKVVGVCLNVTSPKSLALLEDGDAEYWMKNNNGLLFEKYGKRQACKACWKWCE